MRAVQFTVAGTELRVSLRRTMERHSPLAGAMQLGELIKVLDQELVFHPRRSDLLGQMLHDRRSTESRGVRVGGAQEHARQAKCCVEGLAQPIDDFSGTSRIGADLLDTPSSTITVQPRPATVRTNTVTHRRTPSWCRRHSGRAGS